MGHYMCYSLVHGFCSLIAVSYVGKGLKTPEILLTCMGAFVVLLNGYVAIEFCLFENHRVPSLAAYTGEYAYATCFICGETGHLSRMCPDNPRGIYPEGRWRRCTC